VKSYSDYNTYLRSKYGCKVYRIALDAGFSCPNRDGTKGRGGCIYCSESGARSAYTDPGKSIKEQLASRIENLKRTKNATKFIAYFQAFTNTYAPVEKLKAVYDQILGFEEIVGISIATRPDTVDNDKIKLIASYCAKYETWIELGLQSIHNKTLKTINRGHTFEDFLTAFELAKNAGVLVSAHVILGLQGETREEILQTARMLDKLRVDAVKIHLLHVLKGSQLEKLYAEGKVRLMSQSEYVELVCDFLKELSPDIIIQRLTGEGDKSNHIAPAWALNKIETINMIRKKLIS
jgi:hypothetical protein